MDIYIIVIIFAIIYLILRMNDTEGFVSIKKKNKPKVQKKPLNIGGPPIPTSPQPVQTYSNNNDRNYRRNRYYWDDIYVEPVVVPVPYEIPVHHNHVTERIIETPKQNNTTTYALIGVVPVGLGYIGSQLYNKY